MKNALLGLFILFSLSALAEQPIAEGTFASVGREKECGVTLEIVNAFNSEYDFLNATFSDGLMVSRPYIAKPLKVYFDNENPILTFKSTTNIDMDSPQIHLFLQPNGEPASFIVYYYSAGGWINSSATVCDNLKRIK